MARYRIFYAEHGPADEDSLTAAPTDGFEPAEDEDADDEWEETYDAHNPSAALSGFFTDHAPNRENLVRVDEDGTTSAIGGDEFDPDRTYLWVEDGRLMEYQGLQEATPGTVACPLCDGTGEVDEAVAEEYADAIGGTSDNGA